MGGSKAVSITGIRGIPGSHGGFETFAQHFAPYLASRGWDVTVYCQEQADSSKRESYLSTWNGVRRVHIPVSSSGAFGTAVFDLKSILHARKEQGPVLVLGYNTAVFNLILRLARRPLLMNMDGIEWKRAKWPLLVKWWLYINERIAAMITNRMIADHHLIEKHLNRFGNTDKVDVIPYASERVEKASSDFVRDLGLQEGTYFLVVARIEPENSILEIVRAFCKCQRAAFLVVLGDLDSTSNDYHRQILEAANEAVIFPGAIYEKAKVESLRFHALAYVHGHTVGGTNPSLVEALGAGNAIIAHDNGFNRWVAGDDQLYFHDIGECHNCFSIVESDADTVGRMKRSARLRHKDEFTWDKVHSAYEHTLLEFCSADVGR